MSSLPSCVIGDFNDILSNADKRGRIAHLPWLMRGFKEAVQDSQLSDISLEGHPYTWSNGRGTNNWVE